MRIIEEYPVNFLFSLHNSGFGGAYFYWAENSPVPPEEMWDSGTSSDDFVS